MIFYLVATNEIEAFKEAGRRGWERIARNRFVTPAKDDVRVVRRFTDLVPAKDGPTRLVKAADFPAEPEDDTDAAAFGRFVADGHGVWIDP